MIPTRYHKGQKKPWASIPTIDWSHPLTRKLQFYHYDVGGAGGYELVAGRKQSNISAVVPRSSSKYGTGYRYTGLGTSGVTYTSDAATRIAPPYAMATGFMRTGSVTKSNSTIFGRQANDQGSDPYTNWLIVDNPGTPGAVAIIFNTGGVFGSTAQSAVLANNTYHSVAGSAASASTLNWWVDGAAQTTATSLTLQNLSVGDPIQVGGDPTALADQFLGFVYWGAFWSRPLTQAEVNLLHTDPYCFLVFPEDELFDPVVGTAAAAESVGEADGAGTAQAAGIAQSTGAAVGTGAAQAAIIVQGIGAAAGSGAATGFFPEALGPVYLDPTLLGPTIVLSNANLTATQTAAATGNVRATAHHAGGDYYHEFTVNVTADMQVGLCSQSLPLTEYLGEDPAVSIGVDDGGGWIGAGGTTTAPALIAGHVYGLATHIIDGAGSVAAWLKDITAGGNWNADASANPVTGINGATFGGTITIDDGATYPNERYQSGSYLAFQAINDTVSASDQNMVITPAAFPSGVTFNWVWPDAADTSIKSWNAVDFGNYLNTEVPVPITPGKISALDTLKVRTVWTWSMAADSANITMDFFLYNSASSTAGAMLAEFQIFYHTPDSTKTFVDSVTSLGTYTSASIDGTPSIAWHVGRQTANYFGTPYYLFYPVDQSDKLDMTFDAKAALNWLMVPNPTTSVTYFTGDEYFNGLGTGVEPMRKTGTATLGTYLVTYATTAPPPIPPDLPPNTNLIPLAARADFTNAFWTGGGVTRTTGGYTEDTSTGIHGIGPASPVAVSASTTYTFFVDVDVSAGQPWVFLQIQESTTFTSDVQAYFNIAGLSISGLATSGVFTSPTASIALLTTGKYRITLSANIGAGTTAVYVSTRSATGAFGTSYAGSTLKSVALANPFFYT